MSQADVIRRLHQHRTWANHKIIEAVKSLSDEQLQTRQPIGQGSVWKTLTHLMAAEYVWLEALLGNESPLMPGDVVGKLPGNQEGENAVKSLDELIGLWIHLEERWNEYLSNLKSDSLQDTIYKVSTSSRQGQRIGTSKADVLIHVCTHAQYTTAQLINMLRQLGKANLPDTMMITMARDEAVSTG